MHLSVEAKFNFEHFQFFWCGKLGLLTEEEFLSEPGIGFISSSKLKFRDLGQDFWLGETSGKSNPSLTPRLKNPIILKMIVLVDSLYIELGEGSGAETFTGRRNIVDVHSVYVSTSYSLYSRRYDFSKLAFQPLLGFLPKQDT